MQRLSLLPIGLLAACVPLGASEPGPAAEECGTTRQQLSPAQAIVADVVAEAVKNQLIARMRSEASLLDRSFFYVMGLLLGQASVADFMNQQIEEGLKKREAQQAMAFMVDSFLSHPEVQAGTARIDALLADKTPEEAQELTATLRTEFREQLNRLKAKSC